MILMPCMMAIAVVARVASVVCSEFKFKIFARVPFREVPSNIGKSSWVKCFRFFINTRFSSKDLPKPKPGSRMICSFLMPWLRACWTDWLRSSMMELIMLFEDMITMGQACLARMAAICGSCRLLVSLTIEAPAFRAASATWALRVSMEMGIEMDFESCWIIGITRFSSSCVLIGVALG